MKTVFIVFAISMGIGMIAIWIKEMLSSRFSGSFFSWRENGNVMWPHITIELFTALALMTGGVGTWLDLSWAGIFSFFSLGALAYASFNSLSWSFAQPGRILYALPMIAGFIGSIGYLIMVVKQLT